MKKVGGITVTNRSVFIPKVMLMNVGVLSEIRVLLCLGAWSFYSI